MVSFRKMLAQERENSSKTLIQLVIHCLEATKTDINDQDEKGWTPLHHAVMTKDHALLKVLLQFSETDVNAREGKRNRTALMYAAEHGDLFTLRALLKRPEINLNLRDTEDYTALHYAINVTRELSTNKPVAVLECLLSHHDVDIDCIGDDGTVTPLHLAVETHNTDAAALLLQHGAKNLKTKLHRPSAYLNYDVPGMIEVFERYQLLNINHHTLIRLVATYLGEKQFSKNEWEGICYGFSSAYMNAQLLGETQHFFDRLKFINSYYKADPSFKTLLNKIEGVRNKLKCDKSTILSEREELLLEIPPFLNTIILSHLINDDELFPLGFGNTQDYISHHWFSSPLNMTQQPFSLHAALHFFNQDQFLNYFHELHHIYSRLTFPPLIGISTPTHRVVVGLNKTSNKWEVMDLNISLMQSLQVDTEILMRHLFRHHDIGREARDSALVFRFDFVSTQFDLSVSQQIEQVDGMFESSNLDNDEHHNMPYQSLFFFACIHGHVELVKTFLSSQIFLPGDQPCNDTNLLYVGTKAAIHHDKVYVLSAILNAQQFLFNLNEEDEYKSLPFHQSIEMKSIDCMHLLLSRPEIDIHKVNHLGRSPLDIAIIFNNIAALEVLLQQPGININESYTCSTPLIKAINRANVAACERLLAHKKINPNKRDPYGFTPLTHALRQRAPKTIIKLLLAHKKLKPNKRDSYPEGQKTLLHWAVIVGDLDIVIELIKLSKKLVNTADRFGYMPLHIAAQKGRLEICRVLLEQGARNTKTVIGTPSVIAEKNHHSSVAALILEISKVKQKRKCQLSLFPSRKKQKEHDEFREGNKENPFKK